MNWRKLRDPSTWFSAIVGAFVTAVVERLLETYIRPLPMFFDTDAQTWGLEKLGFVCVTVLAGIWGFRKLRALFDGTEPVVG